MSPVARVTVGVDPVGVLYTLDGRGGGEDDMVELERRLEPGRHRLVFATLTDEAADVGQMLRQRGADVRRCFLGRSFPVEFRRLIRQVRPGVVHSRAATYTPLALSVARLCRVPRRVVHLSAGAGQRPVAAAHRLDRGWEGLRRCTGRLVLDAWATDLVGESEVAMRRAWGEAWRLDPRCRLIYPGIEIEPFGVAIAARRRALDMGNGGESEPITVIHMEAFQPAASRVRALDVLGAIRGRGVDARLQVVGRFDPGEVDALRVEACRRGATAHVDLIDTGGTFVDAPKLLASASMLLSTASGGGGDLSRPVLQACAVGTPVLSADLPAIREIARLLPCVTMLPLGADDEVWADTARALTAVPPSLDNRRESLRAFVRSPFTADTWQREVTDLWS